MSNKEPDAFSMSEFAKLTGIRVAEVERSLSTVDDGASLAEVAAHLYNEFAIGKLKVQKGPVRVSKSELSKLSGLDRATIRKRLGDLQPVAGEGNSAVYDLANALQSILMWQTGDIDAEKLRKMKADADNKEMDAQKKRGELILTSEVRDELHNLVKMLDNELCVKYPVEGSERLAKAETQVQIRQILKHDLGFIIDEIVEKLRRVGGESEERPTIEKVAKKKPTKKAATKSRPKNASTKKPTATARSLRKRAAKA